MGISTVAQLLDPPGVDVGTDDSMPEVRQARRGGDAHVSGADDDDVRAHASPNRSRLTG